MSYIHQEFPKWKYHPTEKPVIVGHLEAEKALGEGWVDSPCAEVAPVVELPAGKKPSKKVKS